MGKVHHINQFCYKETQHHNGSVRPTSLRLSVVRQVLRSVTDGSIQCVQLLSKTGSKGSWLTRGLVAQASTCHSSALPGPFVFQTQIHTHKHTHNPLHHPTHTPSAVVIHRLHARAAHGLHSYFAFAYSSLFHSLAVFYVKEESQAIQNFCLYYHFQYAISFSLHTQSFPSTHKWKAAWSAEVFSFISYLMAWNCWNTGASSASGFVKSSLW